MTQKIIKVGSSVALVIPKEVSKKNNLLPGREMEFKLSKKGELVYSAYYYPYVLCKTTGLGAFFRLIKFIYPVVKDNPDNYKVNILNILEKITDEEAMKIFSKTGSFGGSGSEGLQDKLFRFLLSKYDL